MKTCTLCKLEKDFDGFSFDGRHNDGRQSQCKECKNLWHRKWLETHRDQKRSSDLAYIAKDPEKNRKRARAWAQENKEKNVDRVLKWKKSNPEKSKENSRRYEKAHRNQANAKAAKRRATKIQATPPWLSEQQLEEIKQIYIHCPKGYHVDHIIPLKGKNVRGLHVPWNLQVITASENCKKGNKFNEI